MLLAFLYLSARIITNSWLFLIILCKYLRICQLFLSILQSIATFCVLAILHSLFCNIQPSHIASVFSCFCYKIFTNIPIFVKYCNTFRFDNNHCNTLQYQFKFRSLCVLLCDLADIIAQTIQNIQMFCNTLCCTNAYCNTFLFFPKALKFC